MTKEELEKFREIWFEYRLLVHEASTKAGISVTEYYDYLTMQPFKN